ncbi:MAG: hypothetical protein K8U57_36755 [Planctomycetes bacterium]|nr:hypothetical protein [Planctomycetota bacterium]
MSEPRPQGRCHVSRSLAVAARSNLQNQSGLDLNDFIGAAVVAVDNGKLTLKLGPKLRPFLLSHFDRDTFTYQPEGEMAAGLSAVTFRIGPDRIADTITIENLNLHGSGTLTRITVRK